MLENKINKCYIIGICGLFLLFGCKQKSDIKKVDYYQTIRSIREEIIDLTWIEEPLTRPQSRPILENPELYIDSLIRLIKDPNADMIEKGIGLVLMKNLNSNNTRRMTDSIYQFLDKITLKHWIGGAYGNKKLKKLGSQKRKEYLNDNEPK